MLCTIVAPAAIQLAIRTASTFDADPMMRSKAAFSIASVSFDCNFFAAFTAGDSSAEPPPLTAAEADAADADATADDTPDAAAAEDDCKDEGFDATELSC